MGERILFAPPNYFGVYFFNWFVVYAFGCFFGFEKMLGLEMLFHSFRYFRKVSDGHLGDLR